MRIFLSVLQDGHQNCSIECRPYSLSLLFSLGLIQIRQPHANYMVAVGTLELVSTILNTNYRLTSEGSLDGGQHASAFWRDPMGGSAYLQFCGHSCPMVLMDHLVVLH